MPLVLLDKNFIQGDAVCSPAADARGCRLHVDLSDGVSYELADADRK